MNHTVTLTRAGVLLDGRLFYLLAGQLHYFRWPRAEWREQLLKARASGLNTIDTVIPWNLHEPAEGQFNWDDNADLVAYIDLCAELGLYVIARPDPYICAEWENGGFPAWLTARPGLELRVDNEVYLAAMRRWFDKLFPLLAARQITRGGPLILCQIENEHWASGRYGHDQHQQTLANEALARGIDVPQYTCMGAMHEWAEFRNGWSGIAEKLQQTRAVWDDNPMIVSELWSGWFDNWGDSRHNHKTAAKLDITLHQLLAVGASGLSHWMWAGGTNFAHWGGRTVGGDTVHMTTSYDYDAPVSEYGGLTEKFYVARRHHLFLGTLGAQLSAVLADAVGGGPRVIAPAAVAGRGEAGSAPYRNVRAAPDAPDAWRDFTATFLQNNGLEGQTHHVFLANPAAHLAVEVEAASIKPIYTNLPLGEHGLRLEYHTARLLGFWQNDDSDTLVLYGREGETGELRMSSHAPQVADAPSNVSCILHPASFILRYWISDRPTVVRVQTGAHALLIVLLTMARAERWWPTAAGYMCGPGYLEQDAIGAVQITQHGLLPFYQVGLDGSVQLLAAPEPTGAPPAPVVWHSVAGDGRVHPLDWARHAVAERAAADGWQPIEQPRALEELGCDLGYGWYRAEFESEAEQHVTLTAPWLSDRARVLLDGEDYGWLGVDPRGPRMTLPLRLGAGRHDLRLLADNLGRFNYGSNTGERKGLLDTLFWDGQQHDLSEGWVALWQEAVFAGEALAGVRPLAVRPDAANVNLANFAFQGPSVWLLREFTAQLDRSYILTMTGDRNPGVLFINGVNVARFSRHYGGGYIKQDITQHVQPGTNVIALNIQGYGGVAWRATLLEYAPARALMAQWSFRAGVTPGAPVAAAQPGMAFYCARFAYDPAIHGAGPFKLSLTNLAKGHVWLNGRDLGRFWNVGPQEFYKLPVSWLHARADNELLIFDEEGRSPRDVWIGTDLAGARHHATTPLSALHGPIAD